MKTTSYEISKKLAEAGFDGESEVWKHDPENFITGQKYWSYDLETILEALPGMIEGEQYLVLDKDSVGYFEYESIICSGIEAYCKKEENETLADTAARLLMLLVEKGLLTFKK